jgi:predicted DNA-binding ribbon-helix-helix protein
MLAGNKTSISLEYPFWDGLRVIAQNENIPVATLVERIDTDRVGNNLSPFCAELFQNAKSNLVV